MTADSTNEDKWAIGPNCPPGAMVIGEDGEPKFTPYGMGYIAVEAAKSKGMTLEDAATYVAETCGRIYGSYLESGIPVERAQILANRVFESAKMRLEEVYRGSGLEGGAA
ncbi:hypothetical protein [Asaia bogorensis]|uniref:hypothetical protein n=1 Tax=Asaia bogorensis TaxID=91915 RepID=UPI0030163F50